MRRLTLIAATSFICITTFSQSNVDIGVWFKYSDEQINASLFDQYYELASDTFFIPSMSSINSFEPQTIYWNGYEWKSSSESSQQRFLLVMPIADNSARIVLSVSAAANKCDVFTDDGWVHIDNGLHYSFEEDYLHYDESNNRLISSNKTFPGYFTSNMKSKYEEQLIKLIKQNEIVWSALKLAEQIALPNWYIGAGCIAQTVWNHFHGFELHSGIADIDYVYFDKTDLSFEKENEVIQLVKSKFTNLSIPVDVKNQARVHLWYKDHFGYNIKPYISAEDAIRTWPTTATSIGVRLERGVLKLFAPFGLNDLFELAVRANKVQITKEIYLTKVEKWIKKWPKLKVVQW